MVGGKVEAILGNPGLQRVGGRGQKGKWEQEKRAPSFLPVSLPFEALGFGVD